MRRKSTVRKKSVYKELVCWELWKLCKIPMLYVFVLLCIGFNSLLIFGSRYEQAYVLYVGDVRQTVGKQMGPSFEYQVRKLPDSEEKQRLLQETAGKTDIFESYDVREIARVWTSRYLVGGWVARALEWKYEKQEKRVQELAAQDASMDVAAAGMTKPVFDALFMQVCRAVIAEGLLLAVLAALYICRSEYAQRTWQTVYASKRGRYVQREKFWAGILYTETAYGLTALASCGVFAAAWQLGEIWKTQMSTQFYDMHVMGMELPFVPWADFTMRSYLAAVLLLGAVVGVVFYLLGYLAGLLVNHSYAAFTVLFVLAAVNLALIMLAGNRGSWGIYEAAMWTPVAFWWSHPLWFTDMGINAVIPWQECVSGAFCLLAAGLLLILGFGHFYRQDLQ